MRIAVIHRFTTIPAVTATARTASTNTINKIEQGSRNMSMSSLFLFMTAYEADANTLLDFSGGAGGAEEGIDRKLSLLPIQTQDYLRTTFEVMIAQAQKLGA